MNDFHVQANQRVHPRYKVSKDAKVVGCSQLLDVIITDMSVGGVRIQLKNSTDLSGEFKLFVPAEKMLRSVEVRWMKGSLVGLQFVGEPQYLPRFI